jgi:hypothetical protein
MRLDVRAVDHLCLSRAAALGKGPEQAFPNPALGPPGKAIVDRRRRAVLFDPRV